MQEAAPLEGQLLDEINREFGGLEKLQAKMNADSAAVQVRPLHAALSASASRDDRPACYFAIVSSPARSPDRPSAE